MRTRVDEVAFCRIGSARAQGLVRDEVRYGGHVIGRTVTHFRILDQLGAGGMGVVYRAEDLRLHRQVALKFLPGDSAREAHARARLRREAETASSLEHPNICTIYEIGETEEGELFIAMPCYEGETLAARIQRGPLPLDDALEIAEQVARGLSAAHARGFVHRDLKPGNIFLTGDRGVKILDFGLVLRDDGSCLTKPGTALGTIQYMSPEQVRGEAATPASDLWALGCVLHEMIAGRPPFRGDLVSATAQGILGVDPPPLTSLRAGVPLELDHIVTKALRKGPLDRYRHADDLATDLRMLRGSSVRSAIPADAPAADRTVEIRGADRRAGLGEPRSRPHRFGRRPAILLGSLVLAVAAAAGLRFAPWGAGRGLAAEPTPVVVLAFENLTGDPAYDYLGKAVPNLLITSLEQSKALRVTTWERLQDLLRQSGYTADEKLDVEVAFELCRREGIEAVVVGSVVRAGDAFATEAKVLDARNKELLETASARGEGPESILRTQVDELSHDIASRLGGRRRRAGATQSPVIDVTTTSLEAYKEYLRGREGYERQYFVDARRDLMKAVALDSTFAMAQLFLGKACGALRLLPEREAAYRRAVALSDRATERERLIIRKEYARIVQADPASFLALLQELIRKYPAEKSAYVDLGLYHERNGHLAEAVKAYEAALALDPDYPEALNAAGYAYVSLGDYERGLRYVKRYAEVSPGEANPIDSLAETYFLMHRFDEAISSYEQALAVKPEFFSSMWSLAYVWSVRGNAAEVWRWLDRALEVAPTAGTQARVRIRRSFHRAGFGDLQGAAAEAAAAAELLRSSGVGDARAAIAFVDFIVALRLERWPEARRHFEVYREARLPLGPIGERIEIAREHFLLGLIALRENQMIEARAGLAEARRRLTELQRDAPDLTKGLQDQVTLFEAEVLLAEGRPADAIAVMKRDYRHFFPHLSESELFAVNTPPDKDVVARAWLALGEADSALVEYQRLTGDGRPRRDLYVYNYRYELSLARLYDQAGRRDEAAAAYARYLAGCRDANPIPDEVREAQARLAAFR